MSRTRRNEPGMRNYANAKCKCDNYECDPCNHSMHDKCGSNCEGI